MLVVPKLLRFKLKAPSIAPRILICAPVIVVGSLALSPPKFNTVVALPRVMLLKPSVTVPRITLKVELGVNGVMVKLPVPKKLAPLRSRESATKTSPPVAAALPKVALVRAEIP